MSHINKSFNLLLCFTALGTSLFAEYMFCFEGFIRSTGISYLFMLVTIILQIFLITRITKQALLRNSEKHRLISAFLTALIPAVIFFGMLQVNFMFSASADPDIQLNGFIFNLIPLAIGGICFLVRAIYEYMVKKAFTL